MHLLQLIGIGVRATPERSVPGRPEKQRLGDGQPMRCSDATWVRHTHA